MLSLSAPLALIRRDFRALEFDGVMGAASAQTLVIGPSRVNIELATALDIAIYFGQMRNNNVPG